MSLTIKPAKSIEIQGNKVHTFHSSEDDRMWLLGTDLTNILGYAHERSFKRMVIREIGRRNLLPNEDYLLAQRGGKVEHVFSLRGCHKLAGVAKRNVDFASWLVDKRCLELNVYGSKRVEIAPKKQNMNTGKPKTGEGAVVTELAKANLRTGTPPAGYVTRNAGDVPEDNTKQNNEGGDMNSDRQRGRMPQKIMRHMAVLTRVMDEQSIKCDKSRIFGALRKVMKVSDLAALNEEQEEACCRAIKTCIDNTRYGIFHNLSDICNFLVKYGENDSKSENATNNVNTRQQKALEEFKSVCKRCMDNGIKIMDLQKELFNAAGVW